MSGDPDPPGGGSPPTSPEQPRVAAPEHGRDVGEAGDRDDERDDDGDGLVEVDAGDTLWRFDAEFLRSRWTCIWGRGCQGIRAAPAEHLAHGCCSLGAEIDGQDEARNVAALAATLTPEQFQHHALAAGGPSGLFDEGLTNTRVVDGACIFLNRIGFPGGAGCALHLGAVAHGEPPMDWKPSVCWQVPIRVDWELREDAGTSVEVATVRRWSRSDWGPDGDVMAWWCTEAPEAHVGDRPVVESMRDELAAIVGEPVYVELRKKLSS